MRWFSGWVAVVAVGCAPAIEQISAYEAPTYGAPLHRDEEAAPAEREPTPVPPPAKPRLVSADEAAQSGLSSRSLAFRFKGGRDDARLVAHFLGEAERAGAAFVSDLAITLETEQDGRRVECRTELVPEALAEMHASPASYQTARVVKPVERTVTEHKHVCRPVTRTKTEERVESKQDCRMVPHTVSHTRSVGYGEQRRLESHGETQLRYECTSVPVHRTHKKRVTKTECGLEATTRLVTSQELQFETQRLPARIEAITHEQVRELEPVCRDAVGDSRGDRIDGRIYLRAD